MKLLFFYLTITVLESTIHFSEEMFLVLYSSNPHELFTKNVFPGRNTETCILHNINTAITANARETVKGEFSSGDINSFTG